MHDPEWVITVPADVQAPEMMASYGATEFGQKVAHYNIVLHPVQR